MPRSVGRLQCYLAAIVIISFGLALFIGPFGIDGQFSELRFSRVAMALLSGATLAVTGSCLQALLHNSLADPFVIGVSGGAALGGTLGMLVAPFFSSAASLGAMGGALLITLSINALLLKKPHLGSEHILLLGVIFNTIASAIITFIKTILPPSQTQNLLFWLAGNIPYTSINNLAILAFVIIPLIVYVIKKGGSLDILAQGDEEAQRLGLNTQKERMYLYFALSIVIGLIVAQTGPIGFVGLIIPNLLRRIVGPSQKILLPASALCGGAFLVLSDALARLSFVLWSSEIPTGAITTLIGGPVFIWILLREKRKNPN